ncbi:MAG: cytochrome c-type biogenesis protein CcmH [Bryobacteraceae bacterium]
MKQLRTILFLTLLAAAVPLQAQHHSDDPRLEKLYASFISPCCWRENLTVHDSPIADELRTRIASMVAAGETDEHIKDLLVKEYTKQVLSLPEGTAFTWLFATPAMMLLIGGALLLLLLKRMRQLPATPAVTPNLMPADLEEDWDQD